MTKEELKQEAEEWVNKWELCNKCEHKAECIEYVAFCQRVVERAYLAGAEPREKRIEELEKENAETKERIKTLEYRCENIKDTDTMELVALQRENTELKEKLKTAYRKGMRHMAKALKDYDRTDGAWTDYFEHTVDKVLQREQLDFEEYGTLADQLTKAKEHIKRLLDCLQQDTNDPQTNYYVVKYMAEAEQFLKDN